MPPGARSPVLLLGAGLGEATCGILYLASHLRRHGIEAFVRLTDHDDTEPALHRSLEALMKRVQPKLVGVSLKWFHHVERARTVARLIRAIDPEVEIAFGGNTASYYWEPLAQWPEVDHLVLGDGELPLLALARGDAEPPNVISRSKGAPSKAQLAYVQGASTADVHYSHFDELFLSGADLASFSGWVAPGKGCGENCLYCGGTRGMQKATFGRAVPFLRPLAAVQRDHREVVPRTWQLRYDFAGSTAEFLEQSWAGADLSRHATTYFLWGVPPPKLTETLAARFGRVYLVIDVGCFSERQRLEQIAKGLLKPCPTDAELMATIAHAKRFPNLQLEISGIAGLPFAAEATLAQERTLVAKVLEQGCAVGYQRLESQPGALVTEHPERFGMVSEARSIADFLEFFERREPGDVSVPMVRYADPRFEAKVQRTSDEVDALVWKTAARAREVKLGRGTRLVNAAADTRQVSLGHWLGDHVVPSKFSGEAVTVVRSVDGQGLACTPLSPRKFSDPSLQQGPEAVALLAVLDAFSKPTTVEAAVKALGARHQLPPPVAQDAIAHLVEARFLAKG